MTEPGKKLLFMGGEFELKDVKTLGDLRRGLRDWLNEVDGWGADDVKIGACDVLRGKLAVTLQDGIYQ